MTIGDHIEKQRRPYRIASYGFGALAIVSFVGAGALLCRCMANRSFDFEPAWLPKVVNIGCLAGYSGWFLAMMIPVFRLRCPRCREKIGPPKKNWRHCPCCGSGFDEEI